MTPQLTIGCSDPRKMVAFWVEALGYVPEPPPAGHATWRACWAAMGVPETESPPGAGDIPESIIDPAGRGPRVWFQQVPEPKTAKNRGRFDLKAGGGRDVPLDVRAERVKAEAERLGERALVPWPATVESLRVREISPHQEPGPFEMRSLVRQLIQDS